jgi:hypothetical protein
MGAQETARTTWTRWRWRLRGAVMWPTFVVCLALDTFLLHRLPVSGSATTVGDAFVVAGFVNLAAVAVVGPLLALGLRRLRPDLPRVVARDYSGAVALLLACAAVLVAGLANRGTVAAAQRAFDAQALALRRYVTAHAPALRPNLPRADTVRLDTELFRTCVPAARPGTALCLFIDTSTSPPGVRRDSNSDPNAPYFLQRPGDYTSP